MGRMENEIKHKDKRVNMQKLVLGTIYTAGILGVAMVAPNALQALAMLDGKKKRRMNPKYIINKSFARLQEKGLIEIVEHRGKKVARVTKKGEAKLGFLDKHGFKLKQPKRWDGRWRVVIFDIKEKRSKTRFMLRKTLKQIGFVKLQNSVWVYPYDCEDLISLLKADFKIGKDVLYMIVDKLENDWELRRTFRLSKKSGRKG
jgi:CRISPR/Cas system-associated endoribonuclease Cas2